MKNLCLFFLFVQCSVRFINCNNELEFIILHNNDMHARFEETDEKAAVCEPKNSAANHCFGGFERVATV